jgi:hypothetical protein
VSMRFLRAYARLSHRAIQDSRRGRLLSVRALVVMRCVRSRACVIAETVPDAPDEGQVAQWEMVRTLWCMRVCCVVAHLRTHTGLCLSHVYLAPHRSHVRRRALPPYDTQQRRR